MLKSDLSLSGKRNFEEFPGAASVSDIVVMFPISESSIETFSKAKKKSGMLADVGK